MGTDYVTFGNYGNYGDLPQATFIDFFSFQTT